MEEIKITPAKLSGKIAVPPSKSAAHRNIICAALAQGESVITPIYHSDDVNATIRVMTALGATIIEKNGAFYINGIDRKKAEGKKVTLDCGESGSTLRFIIPIAAALGVNATFVGHGKLPNRPITDLTNVLSANGVNCSDNKLPLTIKGKLQVGEYCISGNISSQFLTGLFFAIGINGGSAKLTTPLQSAGYIDLTMKIMSNFGVNITENNKTYSVSGQYTPAFSTIEGDWSQACFFLSGGALGGNLNITGLDFNSTQGDMSVIELYKAFGAKVENKNNCLNIKGEKLNSIEINCSQIPDAVPALAVVAACAKGNTKIYGGERLRIKETDRIKTVVNGLSAMGIKVKELPDGMIITGGKPKGGRVIGTGDHRIVMAFAMLACYADGETVIEGYKSVNKSYPTFFDDFKQIGGISNVITDR